MRLDLDERFDLLGSLPFLCMHIACLLALLTALESCLERSAPASPGVRECWNGVYRSGLSLAVVWILK